MENLSENNASLPQNLQLVMKYNSDYLEIAFGIPQAEISTYVTLVSHHFIY